MNVRKYISYMNFCTHFFDGFIDGLVQLCVFCVVKRLLTLPKLNIFCIIYRTIHGFLRKRLKSKKASKYQQRIQTETNESMLSVLANNLQSIVKKEKPPIILNDYIRIEDGMIKYPENGNEEESGKKRKASGMYTLPTYVCLEKKLSHVNPVL